MVRDLARMIGKMKIFGSCSSCSWEGDGRELRESFERERVSDRERERMKILARVLRVLRVLGKEIALRERERE